MRRGGFVLVVLVALLCTASIARGQTVACSSADGNRTYCEADTRNGVRLVKQLSEAECKQNESWGYDDKGIWVDHGCSGEFALTSEGAATGGVKIVTCSSDGEKKYCDANTGRGVKLIKQRSEAPCKKGSTWDYDGLGIWVDQGCSADFALGGAVPAGTTGGNTTAGEKPARDVSCLKSAGKARAEQLVKQCLQVSPATHPPCNAENSCAIIRSEIQRSCALLGPDAPGFCNGYR